MELATALIWALRIVLPIILFCIYFKLQTPKDDDRSYPGPTKNSHPRSRLLSLRKAVEGEPAPEEVKTITLVTQEDKPELFTTPARRGGRPERGDRGDRGDRRERKERKEPRERKEPKERPEERADTEGAAPGGDSPIAGESPTQAEFPSVPAAAPEVEKQHLESLINYVAFNRKEQQRTFALDEGAPPPPPPTKKPADAPKEVATPILSSGSAKESNAKANTEAQLVLTGAMKYKKADVAKTMYDQLSVQDVEISEKTFTMMIEVCVSALDLKSASDLLMKMETSGHSPDTRLLDKVMDLYSQQKNKRELEKSSVTVPLPTPDSTETPSLLADAPRTKLSSEANLFTPSFNSFGGAPPPPPPPPPPPGPKPGSTEAGTALRSGADPFQAAEGRTALKATSKAFNPSGTVTFDPYEYTWTVDTKKVKELEKGKGKGKGKGKDAGKSGAEKPDAMGKEKGKATAKGKDASKVKAEPAKKNAKDTGAKWVVKA
jgi:pentatricopeptide repeat protein